MKKIYFVLSITMTSLSLAQTPINSESFGVGKSTSPYPLVSAYAGYQSSSPVTFAGNADIRVSTATAAYAGASGQGVVFLGAVTAATLPEKSLTISGIDTQNFTDIKLSFGHYNGLTGISVVPKVEVSEDGATWTALSYARTNTSASVWELAIPTGTIPSVPNLRIRFTNPVNSGVGYRVDDIKLEGTPVALAVSNTNKTKFNVFPTVVSNGVFFVTSDSNAAKNVKIYDLTSKLVINTKTVKEVNVSQLTKGIYMITVEENGVVETKKVVIK